MKKKKSRIAAKTKKSLPTLSVTLDVFSGRTNPSWILTPSQTKEFFEFSGWKDMILTEEMESNLDYGLNGFVISSMSDIDSGLPQTFRIMNHYKRFQDVTNLLKPQLEIKEMVSRELWLLKTAPKKIETRNLFPRFERYIKKTKIPKAVKRKISKSRKKTPLGSCNYAPTAYNPNFWNTNSNTRLNNNCYNYATNYASNTFAQPGRYSGHMWSSASCNNVYTAAYYDGLRTTSSCVSSKNYNYVALVMDPGYDYHWYRYQSETYYGHKPGQGYANNYDASGNTIYNPQTCNRNYSPTGGANYSTFCNYYAWPKGNIVS